MSRSLFVNPSKNFVLPDELGALAGKNAVDWLSSEVINKPTLGTLASKNVIDYNSLDLINKPIIPTEATPLTAGTGIQLDGSTLSVKADQPQITSVGTLTGVSTSGNIVQTLAGTGNVYTVTQWVTGLATNGYVGTQMGRDASIRNSAVYGFVYAGGTGSTSNNMFLGLVGASKVRISGLGDLYLESNTASTSTTTGALRVPGGAGITGDIYVGGVVNTPTAPTAGTHLANKTYVDAQTVTAGTGLTKTGTALAVDAAQPGITSLGTLTGATVAGNIDISGYRRIKQTGGNSSGYTYGAFTGLGDGIHTGYNAYHDNTAWVVPVAGGATSRISCQYGAVRAYTGAAGTAPTTPQWSVVHGTGTTIHEDLTLSKNAIAATAATLGNHLVNKTYVDARAAEYRMPPTGMAMASSAAATFEGVTYTYTASSNSTSAWTGADENAAGGWASAVAYDATGLYTGAVSTTMGATPVTGEWWQVQTSVGIKLAALEWLVGSTTFPVRYGVAGSNDGTTWTMLLDKTAADAALPTSTTTRVNVNSTATYTYHRLVINKSNTTIVRVTDMKLMAAAGGLAAKSVIDFNSTDIINKPTTATQATVTVTHPPMGRPNWGTVTADGNLNEFTAGLLATSSGYSYRLGSSRSASAQYVSNAFDDLQSSTFWQAPLTNYDANGLAQHVDWTVTNVGTRDGSWIQMQVDRAITVTSYTMRCPADSSTSGVSGWIVCGSNDGTTWTELSTVTAYDVSLWTSANGVPATFTPAPAIGGAYTYWRILFTNCKGTLRLSWLDFKGPATQPAFDQLSVTGRVQGGYLSTGNVGVKVWTLSGVMPAAGAGGTYALPTGLLASNVIGLQVLNVAPSSSITMPGFYSTTAPDWNFGYYVRRDLNQLLIDVPTGATLVAGNPFRALFWSVA